MLTTIKGTYYNGTIRLDEPVASDLKGQVLITFLSETSSATGLSLAQEPSSAALDKAARLLNAIGLKQPRFSFDEALALPVEAHGTVSDAATREREESNW